MKRTISFFILIFLTVSHFYAQNTKSVLLLIDIQNFYFKGGKSELAEPVKAAENAAKLLTEFRLKGLPVIHVRHNSEPGGEIHNLVEPVKGEKIISKNEVNGFVGTDLLDYLRSLNISSLVICGMQTHMCVEAAARAAADLGFSCILISDACATRDLKYDDKLIKAEDVQFSTLSTLRSYAKIETTAEFLDNR
jgi:nicotinamidase-related amidase